MNNFDLNIIPEGIDENSNFNQEEYLEEDVPIPIEEDLPFDLNMPAVQEEEPIIEGEGNQHRRLSNDERTLIYEALLQRSINGKLKRTTTTEVADLLSVSLRSVQRIWKLAKNTPNGSVVDLSRKYPKNYGRKRIEFDLSRIADVPLSKRTTLRSLASALQMHHSTLYSRLKEGSIRRHTNALKPLLTEENKIARLRFCISMLEPSSLPSESKFVGMYNTIHIDEKWFYMTKKMKTYYLLPEEEVPLRSCQSKNFIGKVMFLAALARPRFDHEGNEVFSGKLGVFPLVTLQPALRSSRNRQAGTMETKPITSVTKEIIRSFLVDKVIPAIQAKWPRGDIGSTVFIQQDNARTHVRPDDEAFRLAASQSGFDIRLVCQPPNSPDMNVLDLGFFNAIQSLQVKECTRTVDELIAAVQKSYDEYPIPMINRVFLTLQLCMREVMKCQGGIKYDIPHEYKQRLEREGRLPSQITCDQALVDSVMNMLQ